MTHKPFWSALCAIALLCPIDAAAAGAGSAEFFDKELRKIVAERTAAGSLSGAAVAVMVGDRLVFESAAGCALTIPGKPRKCARAFNAEEKAPAAAISPLFDALTFAQLFESGAIDPDADISTYLGWPLRNPAFQEHPITVRHVLFHSSSIRAVQPQSQGDESGLSAQLAAASTFDAQTPPGRLFEYSHLNVRIASALLATKTAPRRIDMDTTLPALLTHFRDERRGFSLATAFASSESGRSSAGSSNNGLQSLGFGAATLIKAVDPEGRSVVTGIAGVDGQSTAAVVFSDADPENGRYEPVTLAYLATQDLDPTTTGSGRDADRLQARLIELALRAADADISRREPRPFSSADDAMPEVDAALSAAARSGKKVLLVLGGNWCHDSRGLAEKFAVPELAAVIERSFQLVWVDVGRRDKNLHVASRFGVPALKGTPTVLVLSPDGALLNAESVHDWRTADSKPLSEAIRYFSHHGIAGGS